MPASVAAILCLMGIGGLFWLDRDKKAQTSLALWIPVVWLFLACSRTASQWLQMPPPIDTAEDVLNGSPIDRAVCTCLLAAGLIVLASRGKRVGRILRANGSILFFVFYCLASLLWSDFPEVGFKRWSRVVGDLVMVLIVLSDPEPLTAFKRLLARLSFVLIPLSILFIKFYPQLGMGWNPWTGTPIYSGVTTNKNTLGVVCLCLGLGTLWRFIAACQDREGAGRTRRMIAHGVILLMVFHLFYLMNAMTATSSLLMASVLLFAAKVRFVTRRPMILHLLVWGMVAISASVLFLGASPEALQAMGRNPTLTDRTVIWGQMLTLVRHPVFGTGFDNFWLGPRLAEMWRMQPDLRPNEAHNGYLEVYLNLGWLGIALLAVVLGRAYRTVFSAWRRGDPDGGVRLGFFFVGLVFNFTEAAFFKVSAVAWLFFLFAIIRVPEGSFARIETVSGELDATFWPGEPLPETGNLAGRSTK